nr:hypothetical protein [Gemmatimonadaceae bacterium]
MSAPASPSSTQGHDGTIGSTLQDAAEASDRILLPDDPADARTRALVHPRDWVNPTPAARYHLVVIGAGTGG